VWNRQHFIQDPASGKRVARPNPRAAWIIEPVPALRIVEPALWSAVPRRLEMARAVVTDARSGSNTEDSGPGANASRRARLVAARRAPWLLSGLVRCGICGGTMTVAGEHRRVACANHRERDTCTNRRTVLRDHVLERVLTGLKHHLLTPELVEAFVLDYIAEVNLANREATARQSLLETDLARIDRQIRTLVQTIADTGGSRALSG